VRRSATHLTLRVDRLDADGNPVHEELTLTTAAMIRAIEELLNVPRPSPHPPLAPRLSDPVPSIARSARGA
jgi:hypothetical protein